MKPITMSKQAQSDREWNDEQLETPAPEDYYELQQQMNQLQTELFNERQKTKALTAQVAGYEDTIKAEVFRLQAGDVVAISLKREFFEQTETHEFYRQGLLKLMPPGVHVVLMADGCTLYELNDTTLMQHGLVRATVTVETLAKRIVELDKLLSEARSNASYWQEHCQSMTADRDALAAHLVSIQYAALKPRGRTRQQWIDNIKRFALEIKARECLRDVQAEAVEWAMNKLRAEYEAHPLSHYSAFAITQHIEAQTKSYAATVRQGGV